MFPPVDNPWITVLKHPASKDSCTVGTFLAQNFHAIFYASFSLLAQMGPQKTFVWTNAIS